MFWAFWDDTWIILRLGDIIFVLNWIQIRIGLQLPVVENDRLDHLTVFGKIIGILSADFIHSCSSTNCTCHEIACVFIMRSLCSKFTHFLRIESLTYLTSNVNGIVKSN